MARGRDNRSTRTAGAPGSTGQEDRSPATALKKGPVRRCTITREQRPRERLLRLVEHPPTGLVPDLAARLPGRGIQVTPHPDQVRTLLKRHRYPPERVAAFLADLERLLARRLLDGIGLARRAGHLRRGLEETETVLTARPPTACGADGVPLLLLAADCAGNTREKARRLAMRHGVEPPLEVLDRQRFGSLYGGGPVAVLAVLDSGMCRRVGNDARRWLEFVTG